MTILQEIQRKRRWEIGRITGAKQTIKSSLSILDRLNSQENNEHKIQSCITTFERNELIKAINILTKLIDEKNNNYKLIKTFL